MIYLFAGDDAKSKRASYDEFSNTLKGIAFFSINKNDFNRGQLRDFYSGAGLFFDKCAVFLSGVLESEDNLEFVLEHLPEMSESENLFIFSEGKLNKPTLDAFRKARAELNIFELPKEKLEKFDNFLLANAFGERDRLNLWVYFRQAIDRGVGMEELVGVLFWKIKDMILKKNFRKFSEAELKSLSGKLAYLLPEARKDGRDAEASLEQFLLEAF